MAARFFLYRRKEQAQRDSQADVERVGHGTSPRTDRCGEKGAAAGAAKCPAGISVLARTTGHRESKPGARDLIHSLTWINRQASPPGEMRVFIARVSIPMFKDLLVPLVGIDGDRNAVEVAVSLAAKLQAHLLVLTIVDLPMPTTGPWGVMHEVGLAGIYQHLREQGEATASSMRIRLARESIRSDVRVAEDLTYEPQRIAARSGRTVDLIIVAGLTGASSEASTVHRYVGGLVMESGTPVLMVPGDFDSVHLPPRRVVVGWKSTREATRAVHDAMPFLRVAEKVDLLMVNPREQQASGDKPGTDMARHLAHHGVNVEVVVDSAGDDGAGSALIRHAAAIDADLIVAGGYGHTRLREWMFGGVTHTLLETSPKPVLFSH